MAEQITSERILTDAEIAAVAVGWQMAHDEACRLGEICSAHQPVSAAAQRTRVVAALLSDWHFMALKDRADWPTSPVAARGGVRETEEIEHG